MLISPVALERNITIRLNGIDEQMEKLKKEFHDDVKLKIIFLY